MNKAENLRYISLKIMDEKKNAIKNSDMVYEMAKKVLTKAEENALNGLSHASYRFKQRGVTELEALILLPLLKEKLESYGFTRLILDIEHQDKQDREYFNTITVNIGW
jgi:hypothetical protein